MASLNAASPRLESPTKAGAVPGLIPRSPRLGSPMESGAFGRRVG